MKKRKIRPGRKRKRTSDARKVKRRQDDPERTSDARKDERRQDNPERFYAAPTGEFEPFPEISDEKAYPGLNDAVKQAKEFIDYLKIGEFDRKHADWAMRCVALAYLAQERRDYVFSKAMEYFDTGEN